VSEVLVDRADVPTIGSRDLGHKVGEAARMVGVSAATVRVWEREGLIGTSRSSSGYRYFGDDDLVQLRRVAYLRRVEKLNTAGIRRVLAEEGHDRQPPRRRREVALGPPLRRMRQERGQTLEQAAAVVLNEQERYVLRIGDSLYYPSGVRHSWRNPGREVARLIWVNTPPTF
jgi:DNA-binding transcriptional MerR regulator